MGTPMMYDRVKDHLDQIFSNPATRLDLGLIEKLQAELLVSTDPKVSVALLIQISALLPVLQEDPTPITNVATKAATYLNFSQIRSTDPPIDIVAGIKAPSPPINLLALSLLRKAGDSASDAAVVAGDPTLVISLVEIWLTTGTTAVAEAAFDVLWTLLEVDHISPPQTNGETDKNKPGGQGLVWRRLFADKNVYSLFFSICSLDNAGQSGQLSKREKSVAQGRLMDFVVRIGSLDWQAIATSHFPDIELRFKSNSLLEFAACKMVDMEDVLLHMTLIHFFSELLKIGASGIQHSGLAVQGSHPVFSSPSLEFLISSGLHRTVMNYYVEPSALDPAEAAYLSGPIMAYISQYLQLYPNHLLQNPQSFLDKLLSRIIQAFDIPSAQWAHGAVPSGDLNILASLPRVMLLEAGKRSLNPLFSIPPKPLHRDTLDTLGRILHGPADFQGDINSEPEDLNENLTSPRAEAAAARTLYFQYLNEHPGIWNTVVAAAEIVAMTDTALAAIRFIKAVATANWEVVRPGPSSEGLINSRFAVPTEDEVQRLGPAPQGNLPMYGAWSLLVPPALTVVLPYLFKDPQTYANFVAGGRGDTESAVWKIATAKYDALVALESSIARIGGSTAGVEDLIRTLKRRVAQGPWGNTSQIGSRVDALEL